MSGGCSYYDVDAILAQEELVPCSTQFDFSHLGHLDPDYNPCHDDSDHLPQGSRIKMPLWAVEKWADLGFVTLSIPKKYGRKARERLEADPADADLRMKNPRFFTTGQMLVDLIGQSSIKAAEAIVKERRTDRRGNQLEMLKKVQEEAIHVRRTLIKTYSGARLRRTIDWALSSGGDDVSSYTSRLTEMELKLFQSAATAVSEHFHWNVYGSRRLCVSAVDSVNTAPSSSDADTSHEDHRDKRRRLQ